MSGALHAILAAMTISNPPTIRNFSEQENDEACAIVANAGAGNIFEMNDGKIREKWTRHQCLNGEGIVTEWINVDNDPLNGHVMNYAHDSKLGDDKKDGMISWVEHVVDLRAHQLLWEREKQMLLLEIQKWDADRREMYESIALRGQRGLQLRPSLSHDMHWDQRRQKAMESEWKETANLKLQPTTLKEQQMRSHLLRAVKKKEDQRADSQRNNYQKRK